jgi:hypothetical protein
MPPQVVAILYLALLHQLAAVEVAVLVALLWQLVDLVVAAPMEKTGRLEHLVKVMLVVLVKAVAHTQVVVVVVQVPLALMVRYLETEEQEPHLQFLVHQLLMLVVEAGVLVELVV